jgi:valyl-tRNA synthetase
VALISEVRAIRSEINVPAGAQIPLRVRDATPETAARLATHNDLIRRLARLDSAELSHDEVAKGSVQSVLGEATLVLPVGGVVDLAGERARLAKEIDRLADDIDKIERKLGNEQFVAKAKPEVVEEQRERQAQAAQAKGKLEIALTRLTAA